MILAKDAVSKNGVVILTKNTRLDKSNYKKLEHTEDISKVEVWSYSIDKRNRPFSDVPKETKSKTNKQRFNPALQKAEFQRFQDVYNKKVDSFKTCVDALQNGEDTNQEELYGIIEGIIDTAGCASDLIQYISYLSKLDDSTYSHSVNVAVLSHVCATWMHFDKDDVEKASVAGLLHDIGKASIDLPYEKLSYKESLIGDDLAKFRKHPEMGYEILLYQDLSDDIKQAVLSHHERIDGSGYPKGIKDKDINDIAKIVSVCDVYDNLVSVEKRCPFDVISDFEPMNVGLLDTKTLFQFTKNITYTYVSSFVELSNDKTAQVMFINPNFLSRPIVKVLDGTVIDLAYDKNVKIVAMA